MAIEGCPIGMARRTRERSGVAMATHIGKEESREVQEFTIHIPDADLEEMYDRLRRTRFAPDPGNDNWDYGFPTEYLREVVD